MLYSIVREAFVLSVACSPVSLKMSHESTVPNASFPFSASSRAPSMLSNTHFIFPAEKYASGISPVFSLIIERSLSVRASIIPALHLHCQTIAFISGAPVSRFQRTVVSR